jgi:hypothetical protein
VWKKAKTLFPQLFQTHVPRSNVCSFPNEKNQPSAGWFFIFIWLCLHIMQHDIIFIENAGDGRIIGVLTTGGELSIIGVDISGF